MEEVSGTARETEKIVQCKFILHVLDDASDSSSSPSDTSNFFNEYEEMLLSELRKSMIH